MLKTKELSYTDFVEGMRRSGIEAGDTVLVQCSYMALRKVEGGPEKVIEGLLEVLGPQGTLVMPTFNWDDFGGKKLYSKKTTRPQTGVLTEILMTWPGVERIYHPIHGFSLVGARAKEFAGESEESKLL